MKHLLRLAVMLLSLILAASPWASAGAEAPEARRLTLDQTEVVLAKGKQQKLKTALENVENPRKVNYAWESSDPDVATVDRGGNIRAREGGSARIICTATLEDGSVLTASAAVTVTVPVSGITIETKANTPIACGETLQLDYTVKPENATNQNIAWSSSNEGILRVDAEGVVTAVAAGKASITGKSDNGKTARVQLAVPTLRPSAEVFTVGDGDTVYHFMYYGDDFEKNVQITAKGDCFAYSLTRNGPDIGVAIAPLRVGEGTLTVKDRKDASAKFTVKIQVTEKAFPAGKLLLIQDAVYHPETGMLTVKWVNTGSMTVTGAEIRIRPMDAEGQTLIVGEGNVEDILLEERILHTFTETKPGEKGTASFGTGEVYPAATEMEIAFDRIEMTASPEEETGTLLELPEDRLCWYATGEKAYTAGPKNGKAYTPPEDAVFALATKARIGITTVPVFEELAEAYGFSGGGLLIVSVAEGSPAAQMGLEPWDLILQVNGAEYAEEPHMMTLACAELAAGNPVTVAFEREGEIWELILTKDE